MIKFLKSHWFFEALAILFIVIAYYLLFYNKSQPNKIRYTGVQIPPTGVTNLKITPELISTPTPTPSNTPSTNATVIPNGPPQGQIVCNYQIPVGPTTYGTADIKATWNNLATGKNGSTQTEVCIIVNGTPALMSLDNSANGSRDTSVSWLAPNGNYTFNLYDNHGGDFTKCAGPLLSSCQITTMLPSTPTP